MARRRGERVSSRADSSLSTAGCTTPGAPVVVRMQVGEGVGRSRWRSASSRSVGRRCGPPSIRPVERRPAILRRSVPDGRHVDEAAVRGNRHRRQRPGAADRGERARASTRHVVIDDGIEAPGPCPGARRAQVAPRRLAERAHRPAEVTPAPASSPGRGTLRLGVGADLREPRAARQPRGAAASGASPARDAGTGARRRRETGELRGGQREARMPKSIRAVHAGPRRSRGVRRFIGRRSEHGASRGAAMRTIGRPGPTGRSGPNSAAATRDGGDEAQFRDPRQPWRLPVAHRRRTGPGEAPVLASGRMGGGNR